MFFWKVNDQQIIISKLGSGIRHSGKILKFQNKNLLIIIYWFNLLLIYFPNIRAQAR